MTFSVAVVTSVGGVVWISELELHSHNDIFTFFFLKLHAEKFCSYMNS